ncbi:Uncharacterized protein TCM_026611 [Theobroma cacao]|uniref:Uncharacterized protein n=1 Tax=Theobroma cacao TaxID=3641 RepID=A0A061F420_THECC|nr:Uncharacterized protein TCM_026611 [Theobroma cacao]
MHSSLLSVDKRIRLKAESYKRKAPLLFSSDHYEDIEYEFEGIKVTWYKGKHSPEKEIIYSRALDDKNYYTLVFHPKDRDIIMERYLNHVLQEAFATQQSGKDPTACLESLIEALAAAKEKKIEEEDAKTLEIAEEEEIEEEIAKKEEIEEKDAKTLETVEEKEIEEKTVEEEETEEEDAKILETAEEKNKKEE